MVSPVVVSRIQNRRGTQAQFDALYPLHYNGTGGYGSSVGFNSTNYPDVLLAGELALCTDTRRVIIGNINAEFTEITNSVIDGVQLAPLSLVLPPAASFTSFPCSGMTYNTTPFTTFLYDVTNSLSPSWDVVGPGFSRNGELKVTAVNSFAPISNAPFPQLTPVSLVDSGVEINTLNPKSITFIARYTDNTSTQIEILYKHDFASALTFSTSTIKWLPF